MDGQLSDGRAQAGGRDLLPASYRLLGLLPLAFFLAHAYYYWRRGEPSHILWMCNIGNLLLSAGIFLAQPAVIRVAVIWLIPGLLIWLWYVVRLSGLLFTSTLAHVGGLAVGLFVLRRVGVTRVTWLHALAWYLFLQGASRLFTPPEMNVNIAHRVYEGWGEIFGSYFEFWLVTTLVIAALLWLIVFSLAKLLPPRQTPGAS